MVNSNKTPTGKTSKGKVSIYVEKSRIKARLPRQYFGGEQPRIALGMDANEANMARAQRLAERMTLDLQDGCFDETLAKYGIIADLKLKGSVVTSDDQLPPKPELSLMEVWDMYCEYRKHDLKETTYELTYRQYYVSYLKSAINATKSEDAIKIRNWLIEHRSLYHTKNLISQLSDAYELAKKNKKITYNPYEGLASEIKVKGAQGKTQNEVDTENDDDVLDKTKAYTWNEAQIILGYTQERSPHWYDFLKFKFLTGCRTGEAIAFMWCDVLWNKEQILIRRTYSSRLKKFYPTKTAKGDQELIRIFPMPKDGELWNLLKSSSQGESNEVVFKSKSKRIISDVTLVRAWKGREEQNKGIIPPLIEQGKLTKYLPPYNTRHTFITHQIFDLGRDEKIVSAWCGHGELVSQKHYQDIADRATQINPELPANQQAQQQSDIETLKEQVREQQELINKLMQDRE
ncbi:MAG: tyrosine-type recombinase/integrase [Nostoc sp.]|uniref:tyrosine-type recombinase/integrase n=1 Tax=Nostoc sp. TaxID=1180 RepID=UPI002FFB3061